MPTVQFKFSNRNGYLIRALAGQTFSYDNAAHMKGDVVGRGVSSSSGEVSFTIPATIHVHGYLTFEIYKPEDFTGSPSSARPKEDVEPIDSFDRVIDDGGTEGEPNPAYKMPVNQLIGPEYSLSFHHPTALQVTNYTIAKLIATIPEFGDALRRTLGIGKGKGGDGDGSTASNKYLVAQVFEGGFSARNPVEFPDGFTVGTDVKPTNIGFQGLTLQGMTAADGALMPAPDFEDHGLKGRQLSPGISPKTGLNYETANWLTHAMPGLCLWTRLNEPQGLSLTPGVSAPYQTQRAHTPVGKALKGVRFQLPENGVYIAWFRGVFECLYTQSGSQARYGQVTVSFRQKSKADETKSDSVATNAAIAVIDFQVDDALRTDLKNSGKPLVKSVSPWTMFSGSAGDAVWIEFKFEYLSPANGLSVTLRGDQLSNGLIICKTRAGVE